MTIGAYALGAVLTAAALLPLVWAAIRLRARLVPEWDGALARLAEAVAALALLLAALEVVGSVGLFRRVWIVGACAAVGVVVGLLARPATSSAPRPALPVLAAPRWARFAAIGVVALLAARWAQLTRIAFGDGITDYDSLHYHLPMAGRFVQSGWLTDLVFTTPEFPNMVHPANSELLHAFGMALFGHDILSPLHSLGWLALMLLAGYCIGRPWGAGPLTLIGTGVVLATPLIAGTQGGSALTDVPSIALVLCAAAFLVQPGRHKWACLYGGAAAGLAIGTKSTVLVTVAVLTLGVVIIAGRGRRWLALRDWSLGVVATGAFWYLRNLVQTGSPLPSLPLRIGPLGFPQGRFALVEKYGYTVADYFTDGDVWRNWYRPGLRDALGPLWWAFLAVVAIGIALMAAAKHDRRAQMFAAAVVLTAIGYVATPTSAYGFAGRPVLFMLNFRYVYAAFALALTIPFTLPVLRTGRRPLVEVSILLVIFVAALVAGPPLGSWPHRETKVALGAIVLVVGGSMAFRFVRTRLVTLSRAWIAVGVTIVVVLVVGGFYREQDRYFNYRYNQPLYRWAATVHDQRIGVVNANLQYGLLGPDLSNEVQYVGREGQHGAFHSIRDCRDWRRALVGGQYDYVVYGSTKRVGPKHFDLRGVPKTWTASDPGSELVLEADGALVYRLDEPPQPAGC